MSQEKKRKVANHSCQESRSSRDPTGAQGALGRRDVLKLTALAGAGLMIPGTSYEFNWLTDIPPSLMLHSGNVEFLPALLPGLLEDFQPMTYQSWLDKLARLEGYAGLIAGLFGVDQSAVMKVLARRQPDKLPLVISIDDVGTDWIRHAHLSMFDLLLEAGVPAVVGVQPKVMPAQEVRYWQRIKELHEEGWEIASHSINHPPLTQVNRRTASFEILESCDRIEAVIGQRPITLITPFGDSRPPTDTSEGNKQLYELAMQADLLVIAGIRDGRNRLEPDLRQALQAEYSGGPIPEYVGRLEPDSQAKVTLSYLHNFNR